FDALVDKTLKQWHVLSISFAITDRSSTHTKCYGLADVDSSTPVDDKTLHYIASLTKAHLSAAWALYISSAANQAKPERERITWRTPLAHIIPDDFQLSDPARTNEVTLEDALSHRTGLPRHDQSRERFDIKTTKALTRNLRNLPFQNSLRTRFEYCNVMFVAASHALETVTGKPLATVLREWLWDPMGMDSTYAGDSEAAWTADGNTLATGYAWSKPRDAGADVAAELEEQPHPDLSVTSGAGYAISTVRDYIKWMQGLLGIIDSPLTDDIVHSLWTARTLVHEQARKPPCEGLVGYGLGWFIAMYRGQEVRWHSGGLAGAGSLVVILPNLQWGVTYFANAHDVSASLKGLAFELVDIRLDVPEQER
ncbi:beta-lactamase/transpeptidase-like protein, partial [Neohortaea acidophila]